jgi:hypothetical protein
MFITFSPQGPEVVVPHSVALKKSGGLRLCPPRTLPFLALREDLVEEIDVFN